MILVASGSEVALVVQAYEALTAEGVAARVVSMPSWELFDRQDQSYRESVLPPAVHGPGRGRAGIDLRLGAVRAAGRRSSACRRSAPPPRSRTCVTKFGFTPEAVVATAKEQIARHVG